MKTFAKILRLIAILVIIIFSGSCDDNINKQIEEDYDLVILNGRVMDPETNFDAVRNVGIKNGKIVINLCVNRDGIVIFARADK